MTLKYFSKYKSSHKNNVGILRRGPCADAAVGDVTFQESVTGPVGRFQVEFDAHPNCLDTVYYILLLQLYAGMGKGKTTNNVIQHSTAFDQ